MQIRSRLINDLRQLSLSSEEANSLAPVTEKFAFRISEYYSRLIDWNDSNDPLRQLVMPKIQELSDWGDLDASEELKNTPVLGLQHKYPDTALLICSNSCASYCRYCFRKRLFTTENHEATTDLSDAFAYIASHREINNVLLTGGDPLSLPTAKLAYMIKTLRAIDHVKIIRIGSKVPAFDPQRLTLDNDLMELLRQYSTRDRRIYLITHFDHPREITDCSLAAIDRCLANGVICANQCPVIRGVNDCSDALATLFNLLGAAGCPQYYVFQCRPTAGNLMYTLPLVETWNIVQGALQTGCGLFNRCRFVASHATGKIEFINIDSDYIVTRYHQARNPSDRGRFITYRRNDQANWIDELEIVDT